jgi:hypothetical protein
MVYQTSVRLYNHDIFKYHIIVLGLGEYNLQPMPKVFLYMDI